MSTAEQISDLRVMLGETIAEGETEAETLFTDAQLTRWIEGTDNLEAAAAKGWQGKMANFANLVDVTDGAASRALSDLMENAKAMVAMYTKLSRGPVAGRARVGKIVRP